MLKPENATALQDKFKGKGAAYFERLIQFFNGLCEDDGEEVLYAWLNRENLEDRISEIDDNTVHDLWEKYIEPGGEG